MFSTDCMHHTALNIPDLFLPLWRARVKKRSAEAMAGWPWATLRNEAAWNAHGAFVARAGPYWPGSFDRIPRNPAEKLHSGYKAWEYMLYFYGIGPGAFFDYLPDIFWRNYCQMVKIVRTCTGHRISIDDVNESRDVGTFSPWEPHFVLT